MKQEFLWRDRVTWVARLALIACLLSPLRSADAQTNPSRFIVYGRVVASDEESVPLSTSVTLKCGGQVLEAIHPDTMGSFRFTLGAESTDNVDVSAANSTYSSEDVNHTGSRRMDKYAGIDTFNCELDAHAPGYRPLFQPILLNGAAEIGGVDAGSLFLVPMGMGSTETGMVSVTTLLVPNNARKEFEKGDKDAHKNRLASAVEHLKKAVAEYDKYAIAWNELGRIYTVSHELKEAYQAFQKATAADPKYVPPYLGLATLELNDGDYQSASDTAGEALALDRGIALASFLQAAANYSLHRLDAAEKCARDAERWPHQNIPQLHVLLGEIYLQKQEGLNAAAEMRAYLKESPQGELASEMKKKLGDLEKSYPAANDRSARSRDIAP